MSQLLIYREKLNLTQEQLATKANVSVRTIQRIEAGTIPKGHTLDALCKALDISKEELLQKNIQETKNNYQLLKYINLSSLLLLFIPLGSIIAPLILMHWKKEVNSITKQIVSVQIVWTIAFPIITLAIAFIGKWLSLNKQVLPLTMVLLFIINVYIILRNAIEINKNKKLYIGLNFNLF
ncbi:MULTISPECIES: helix-turn-helix domain-containing protein [Flavobacterium]|uniref:Helix-turn-helix domain-containing protein n=1 Tax=Flavobacterium jumunjinense TaxID=998845 RepID=A0ABV5GU76_9FLAO|nr:MULTISPECIES: helix-turn-helix domain-containing protein [Flavobacterium]